VKAAGQDAGRLFVRSAKADAFGTLLIVTNTVVACALNRVSDRLSGSNDKSTGMGRTPF
jgi:hypothetical protein